jgi:hypothetical protein
MKRLFLHRAENAGASTSATRYIGIDGHYVHNATEANVQMYVPMAGTFRNLRIKLIAAPGGGGTYSYTLRVNGANSSLSVAIADPATSGSDVANDVSVSAGDLVCISVVPSSSPSVTDAVSFVLEFEADAGTDTFIGTTHANLTTLNAIQPLHGEYGASWDYDWASSIVAPRPITINALYVKLSVAPGAGTSRTFTIYKDGAPTAATVTISGTDTSGSITGLSVSVSAGNKIYLYSTRSGAVAASIGYISTSYTPDNADEFLVGDVGNFSNLVAGATLKTAISDVSTTSGANPSQLLNDDYKVIAIAYGSNVAQGAGEWNKVTLILTSDSSVQTPTVTCTNDTQATATCDWTPAAMTFYCGAFEASASAANVKPLSAYAMKIAVTATPLIVALSDQSKVIRSAITLLHQRTFSRSLADASQVITDLVSYALDPNFTVSISDSLPIIADTISVDFLDAFVVNVSDTLMVIQDSIQAGKVDLDDQLGWIAPITITPQSATINPIYLAAHAVRHPTRFFEGKVKSYGRFTRSIGAPAGFIRTGDVSLSIIDADNSLRQSIAPKTIKKAQVELRLGPAGGSFASFLRPYLRELENVTQPADGELSISLHDFVADWMDRYVPSNIDDVSFPNMPEGGTDFSPIIIGYVSSNYGAIPCPLVDSLNFRYLVARHACLQVAAVYRKRGDEDEFTLVNTSEYSIVEDQLNYYGAYCCTIDFTSDQAGAEIRANVQGLYDATTGLLRLTNFSDLILDIYTYIAGISESYDLLNLPSFEIVRTKVATLLCAGAWIRPITFGEAISQVQRSCNVDIFNDKWDRITVAYTADTDSSVQSFDDLVRLGRGTVRQMMAEPCYNRLP